MGYIIDFLTSSIFFSFAIIVPAFAGELLHYQEFQEKREGSFLFYLRTTFLSRNVAWSVMIGYCVCIIMLGLQAVITWLGQRYLDVWVEYSWLSFLTSAHWPFLAAFTMGYKAAFSEEITYRLYTITLGKKVLKMTILGVIFSSFIWGFAHSNYPVYPMWFRGFEVTCLGFFLAFLYLRFGIIPVLVGHYLFDVFWGSIEYLLGSDYNFHFFSTLTMLLIPLLFALVALIANKCVILQPMRWKLNKHQRYNLEILKNYLHTHREKILTQSKEEIIKEIASHGWDMAVVEIALEDYIN